MQKYWSVCFAQIENSRHLINEILKYENNEYKEGIKNIIYNLENYGSAINTWET